MTKLERIYIEAAISLHPLEREAAFCDIAAMLGLRIEAVRDKAWCLKTDFRRNAANSRRATKAAIRRAQFARSPMGTYSPDLKLKGIAQDTEARA